MNPSEIFEIVMMMIAAAVVVFIVWDLSRSNP